MIEQEKIGQHDGRTDFDFYIGTWNVHHRLLRKRLNDSQEWDEYEGRAVARKVLDGLGNVDEITIKRPSGRVIGMTVRLFDPYTQQWSIYWADTVNGGLQPPMFGEFKDGRGIFYNQETLEGKKSLSALFGLPSLKTLAGGSKHSHRMAATPGKPTGSWSSCASSNGTIWTSAACHSERSEESLVAEDSSLRSE